MTYPEGRQPIEAQDMAKLHPSTWQQEIETTRAHIKAALDCLNASKFTNAEHARAKDILRVALGDDQ